MNSTVLHSIASRDSKQGFGEGRTCRYAAAPGKHARESALRAFFVRLAVVLTLATALNPAAAAEKTAIFAGGCFWCVEADFAKQPGVVDAISGFSGGTLQNPTYRGNHKGHYEAVEITYDDTVTDFATLLEFFWRHIDPLDAGGQFCDRGFSYKTAVFVRDDEERAIAQESMARVQALFPEDPVATVILPKGRFWPVEEYHQDYAEKNPLRYRYYRTACRRDSRVNALWGDK